MTPASFHNDHGCGCAAWQVLTNAGAHCTGQSGVLSSAVKIVAASRACFSGPASILLLKHLQRHERHTYCKQAWQQWTSP